MRKGSTIIEALLLIFIYSMVVITLFGLMQQYQVRKPDYNEIQDLISIHQLETLFLIASITEVNSYEIEFLIGEDTFYLEEVNNRIIISPGTQILFMNVEYVHFEQIEDKIMLLFDRDDKEFSYEVRLFR